MQELTFSWKTGGPEHFLNETILPGCSQQVLLEALAIPFTKRLMLAEASTSTAGLCQVLK